MSYISHIIRFLKRIKCNQIGLTDTFSRTVTTEDLETNFNTETVFWIETDPDTEPFDYRVVAISRTINQVVLALAEVEHNESNE